MSDAPATEREIEPETVRRRRVTPFRVVLVVLVLLVAAVAWSAWSVYRAQADLRAADDAYDDLARAFAAGDRTARDTALVELRERAGSAHDRTDGAWWGLMSRAPGVGSDLQGVERLAAAFDVVAVDGLEPLFTVVDSVTDQGLAEAGRVDLDLLSSYDGPVGRARDAFAAASAELAAGDPADYSTVLRTPYESQAVQFDALGRALATAARASEVLPRMLGADGPRDYLLVLQDNGTVRATGGLPVSWAQVRADAGRLTIRDQGGPDDFAASTQGITPSERALYGDRLGREFADAGLTPDFPRTAELWRGHYAERRPGTTLDGVVAVDAVTLSGVLSAIGSVDVNGIELRAGNVVGVLSSDVHRRLDARDQAAAYSLATERILDAVLTAAPGAYQLVLVLAEAAEQGRVLVAPFDEADAADLAGSTVLGGLTGDDGRTPHVDVGLVDDTGGAMSYYLRHEAAVEATGCDGGRQQLTGTLTLEQDLAPADAAALVPGVAGDGDGGQAVVVRLSPPYAGSIDTITVDGREEPVRVFGGGERPTAALRVVLTGREPVEVTWTMTSGPGQTDDGEVGVTPGIEPTTRDSVFSSACR